jgi:hypothetical protein
MTNVADEFSGAADRLAAQFSRLAREHNERFNERLSAATEPVLRAARRAALDREIGDAVHSAAVGVAVAVATGALWAALRSARALVTVTVEIEPRDPAHRWVLDWVADRCCRTMQTQTQTQTRGAGWRWEGGWLASPARLAAAGAWRVVFGCCFFVLVFYLVSFFCGGFCWILDIIC